RTAGRSRAALQESPMTPVRPELVVIGVSLGGLAALSTLFRRLPAHFAIPVVVVQLRATDADGAALAALLQGKTALPVTDAVDKMPIEAGRVYLAPADYHLMVEEKGLLALSTDAPVRSARPAIDVLFETAADA